MNRILSFILITIFSIFLGSQITEGCLLIPYWKSLTTSEFYEYYAQFGPIIGEFYTILTVFAAIIPISCSVYCYFKKTKALLYSLISSMFILLCITLFYMYFKDVNQQFYNAIFTTNELKATLKIWEYWHWIRVFLESLSLLFLIFTLNILTSQNLKKQQTVNSAIA